MNRCNVYVAGICVEAVSYTHLDVYKRQAVCRSNGHFPLYRAGDLRKRTAQDRSAVSYTHLDVYKRQVISLFAAIENVK